MRGRILYDFSGSACEGYKLQFRQVSELDNGEGKITTSDLRSNTWENADAKKFSSIPRISSTRRLIDAVDGHAERQSSAPSMTLTKPGPQGRSRCGDRIPDRTLVRAILDAAHEGKTILEFPIYDGSETGEKVYNTLTVIGARSQPITKPADAAAGQQALAGMQRWPVTVSYFDKAASKTGEQTPVYAISFELYENGISRALMLDYNDFSIAGKMKTLEIKDAKPCP